MTDTSLDGALHDLDVQRRRDDEPRAGLDRGVQPVKVTDGPGAQDRLADVRGPQPLPDGGDVIGCGRSVEGHLETRMPSSASEATRSSNRRAAPRDGGWRSAGSAGRGQRSGVAESLDGSRIGHDAS